MSKASINARSKWSFTRIASRSAETQSEVKGIAAYQPQPWQDIMGAFRTVAREHGMEDVAHLGLDDVRATHLKTGSQKSLVLRHR